MEIVGLDTQAIIEKYQGVQTTLYDIENSSAQVIGQEVDVNNMLVYVIRDGDTISLVHAVDCQIIPQIHVDTSASTVQKVVSNSSNNPSGQGII